MRDSSVFYIDALDVSNMRKEECPMKMVRKFFCIALCSLVLVNFCDMQVEAQEATIGLFYIENCSTNVYLNFMDNKATYVVKIRGNSSISKISGTISLYDETTGTNVGSWYVNHSGYVYSTSKTITVKAGHKYTLNFAKKLH